ncbi:DNA starvation/stationary phase protection protein Dps [Kovacikia minuta CCNUW1]|uniref:DNA starvation/stationary phase protection protein Dps n=1 Tax=Kovacikia minuta TaxID=2931930 RepID=UPI001CCDD579|nr:DNA starvation/stationary phase protection protein Dps [Kovacikia minuta]UBF28160.1 DNA starvation/stationary phase protection protein Dps [Kovacikia minuta CCNUW1]
MSNNGSTQILYSTRIDLSADIRSKVIALLNQTLAATLDLKTQVKQAHWNVKGLDFYQLHELFDEFAAELEEYIDMVAERITALGGLAIGTARAAAANSILPEYPFDILDGKDHVTALADRFAPYAKHLRDGIAQTDDLGDADTADLYTELSRAIDKDLWFLEAHLQAGESVISSNGAVPKTAKTAATRSTAAKSTSTKAASTKTSVRKPRAKSK